MEMTQYLHINLMMQNYQNFEKKSNRFQKEFERDLLKQKKANLLADIATIKIFYALHGKSEKINYRSILG